MISAILNNKTIWNILLLASYSPGSGYTRNELKKLAKLDNGSLDKSLIKLEFHKIIIREKRIIKLNFGNPLTQEILDFIEREKKRLNYPNYELLLALTEFVRLSEQKNISNIYLFGSHAKKTASEKSDIDIAVFSEKKINLANVKESIFINFGKEVQIHYFDAEDIKGKSKIIQNILKDGIRLI